MIWVSPEHVMPLRPQSASERICALRRQPLWQASSLNSTDHPALTWIRKNITYTILRLLSFVDLIFVINNPRSSRSNERLKSEVLSSILRLGTTFSFQSRKDSDRINE